MHLIDGFLRMVLVPCWGKKIVTLFSRSNTPKDISQEKKAQGSSFREEGQETTPLSGTLGF